MKKYIGEFSIALALLVLSAILPTSQSRADFLGLTPGDYLVTLNNTATLSLDPTALDRFILARPEPPVSFGILSSVRMCSYGTHQRGHRYLLTV